MSIQTLRVSISQKGKGETSSFERGYSMRDDFDGVAVKDAHSHAQKNMGLTSDYVVAIAPMPDTELEEAVSNYLSTHADSLFDQVVNPLQSCFKNYRLVSLCGKLIAISTPYSFGYRYGVVNPEWVEEAGEFSSITLPKAA